MQAALPDLARDFHDYEKMRRVHTKLGLPWFVGDMNLNFTGIRVGQPEGESANKFNDYFIFSWKQGEESKVYIYKGTTDPGAEYVDYRDDGLARAEPGFYTHAFQPGDHKGRPALRNREESPIAYRRIRKDGTLSGVYTNYIGLHHHDSGLRKDSDKLVRKWSLGCQVALHREDIIFARNLVHYQNNEGFGNKLSYSLIELKDLFQ